MLYLPWMAMADGAQSGNLAPGWPKTKGGKAKGEKTTLSSRVVLLGGPAKAKCPSVIGRLLPPTDSEAFSPRPPVLSYGSVMTAEIESSSRSAVDATTINT